MKLGFLLLQFHFQLLSETKLGKVNYRGIVLGQIYICVYISSRYIVVLDFLGLVCVLWAPEFRKCDKCMEDGIYEEFDRMGEAFAQ